MLWPLNSCSGVFMTTLQGPEQSESMGGGWTLQAHQSVSSLWAKAKVIFIFPWVERESTEAREKNGKEWMRNPPLSLASGSSFKQMALFWFGLSIFCLPTKGDLQSSVQKGSNTAACSHTSGAKGERLWEFPASFPCLPLFLFLQEITVWEFPPTPPIGKKDREDILDILCREKGLNVWIWGSPCYTNCNLIVFTRTHVC